MTTKLQFGLAAVIVFGFSLAGSSVAEAQRMAPVSSSRVATVQPRSVRSVRPITRRNGGFAGASSRATSNGFALSSSSSFTLQQLLDPVPPPGFDYAYLSAIDADLGIKAFINPATQLRLAAAERFLRGTRASGFAGSGFYLFDGGGEYPAPDEEPTASDRPAPAPQPQIIVLQQAPAAQQPDAQAEPESATETPEPLPDVGQFTLVLRNGSQIQAVAFTRSNDKIVYITVEGGRRTIALADLDSAETVRVNQERGTPLQFPM
jgi:hypothetical protein